jgi:glycosyltransferase involved in cell wall biosynthesis
MFTSWSKNSELLWRSLKNKSPLILVGDPVDRAYPDHFSQGNDQIPRRDYWEIAQKLGATLIGYDAIDSRWYRWVRRLETFTKFDLIEALIAFGRRAQNSVILSTSEKLALPFSMLSVISGHEFSHVTIAHKLSSSLKSRLFHVSQLHRTFSRVITVCRSQADYAVGSLGLAAKHVDCIYHNVDQKFFRPLKGDDEGYILAAGREQRDYDSLLEALCGTGIRLVVVTSSPWSSGRVHVGSMDGVTMLSHISYPGLRDLYNRARLVVLPLYDVEYAAGSTMLLEAMAMGKPLICSRSRGIEEYIEDGQTGMFVKPRDAGELREAILSLWEQPSRRARLGENARQAVEEKMSLERYVNRVTGIVEEAISAV